MSGNCTLAKSLDRDCPLVDLFHDVNSFDIGAGASLLAAMLDYLPDDAIVVGVVDPGVGGGRLPIAVELGERWLVGPDNGLFSRSIAWSNSEARYWTSGNSNQCCEDISWARCFFARAAT